MGRASVKHIQRRWSLQKVSDYTSVKKDKFWGLFWMFLLHISWRLDGSEFHIMKSEQWLGSQSPHISEACAGTAGHLRGYDLKTENEDRDGTPL